MYQRTPNAIEQYSDEVTPSNDQKGKKNCAELYKYAQLSQRGNSKRVGYLRIL